jgi:hypothetical protein
MNKGLRNLIAKRKFKRIIDILGIEKCYKFKAQSKPCSYYMCSPYKYTRKLKHKGKEID